MSEPKLTWRMKDGTLLESDTWPHGALGLHPNGAAVPKSLFPGLFKATDHHPEKSTVCEVDHSITITSLNTSEVLISPKPNKVGTPTPQRSFDVSRSIQAAYQDTLSLFLRSFKQSLPLPFVERMACHFVNATMVAIREKLTDGEEPSLCAIENKEEVQMTMFDTLLDYVYQTEEYVIKDKETHTEAQERLDTDLAHQVAEISRMIEKDLQHKIL